MQRDLPDDQNHTQELSRAVDIALQDLRQRAAMLRDKVECRGEQVTFLDTCIDELRQAMQRDREDRGAGDA